MKEIFSYQRSSPTAFLRLKGKRFDIEMVMFGSSSVTDESRMFCWALTSVERLSPMLLNVKPIETDDVRVVCVRACGLYIDVRLFCSKLLEA